MVLFAEFNFQRSFERMGGLNATDVRREIIPLLWSNLSKRVGQMFYFFFSFNIGDMKYLCVSAEERNCLEGLYTVRRSER